MESSSPFETADIAQSVIEAFVTESLHTPVSTNESSKRSMREATSTFSLESFDTCISTLTASTIEPRSAKSKMLMFSNASEEPGILNAQSTSCEALNFASSNDISVWVTRYITRSYSNSVSKLMFTFLRFFKSLNAWSVISLSDSLPVSSLRYFPVTSNMAHVEVDSITESTTKSPLPLLAALSKTSPVSSIVSQSIPRTVTAEPSTNGPFCAVPAIFIATTPMSPEAPPATSSSPLELEHAQNMAHTASTPKKLHHLKNELFSMIINCSPFPYI